MCQRRYFRYVKRGYSEIGTNMSNENNPDELLVFNIFFKKITHNNTYTLYLKGKRRVHFNLKLFQSFAKMTIED